MKKIDNAKKILDMILQLVSIVEPFSDELDYIDICDMYYTEHGKDIKDYEFTYVVHGISLHYKVKISDNEGIRVIKYHYESIDLIRKKYEVNGGIQFICMTDKNTVQYYDSNDYIKEQNINEFLDDKLEYIKYLLIESINDNDFKRSNILLNDIEMITKDINRKVGI
ncbi:MAG: hypothetical protein ACRCX2_03415 [Paraclostridium sp.]